MPQVTELRSCTLSSTIHIFTKSRSLSLLPKPWIKWKKLLAVSRKASSSFLDKFLQALRLNLIFTRVILLSILVICSVPNKIFSITFLSSWIIKAFKPSRPNVSKKKMSVFGSMSSMLHQWVPPLLEMSVFAIRNGYFPFFLNWWICSCSLREGDSQNCCLCLHLLYFWKLPQFGNCWFHCSFFFLSTKQVFTFSFTFLCVSFTL